MKKKLLVLVSLFAMTSCSYVKEYTTKIENYFAREPEQEIVKEDTKVNNVQITLIDRAEKALNDWKTAQGVFLQEDPNGEFSKGQFWIEKPGKMRFEYALPNHNFIVSNGSFVFFWDEVLQQQTNAPLSYTPAKFLLQEHIILSGDIQINNLYNHSDFVIIEIYSKESKDLGTVSLWFNKQDGDDLKLSKWQIQDVAGNVTTTTLQGVVFDQEIDPFKFKFEDPRRNPFELN